VKRRKRAKREQRKPLCYHEAEKKGKKGTEKTALCPWSGEKRQKGNRGSRSVPVKWRKKAKREQRKPLCYRRADEKEKKGTERAAK